MTAGTTLTFELTVTAGGASVTDAVGVVIQADNDPPTANAGADQTVSEGMAVTLAGSGSDPEDAALTYAWRQSGSNPTVPLAGASTTTPTFTAPGIDGRYGADVRVDGDGGRGECDGRGGRGHPSRQRPRRPRTRGPTRRWRKAWQ